MMTMMTTRMMRKMRKMRDKYYYSVKVEMIMRTMMETMEKSKNGAKEDRDQGEGEMARSLRAR